MLQTFDAPLRSRKQWCFLLLGRLLLGSVCSLSFRNSSAHTQEGDTGLQLEWTAPGSCPAQREVLLHIRDLLGNSSNGQIDALHARARIIQQGEYYELELIMHRDGREKGKRTLKAATCEDAASAASVIIAMTLDANLEGQPSVPTASCPAEGETSRNFASELEISEGTTGADDWPVEDASDTSKAPDGELVRSPIVGPEKDAVPSGTQDQATDDPQHLTRPEAKSKSSSKRPSTNFFFFGIGTVLDFGILPNTAPGPAFTLGVRRGRFELNLSALYLPPVLAEDPQASDKGGNISLFSIGPDACFVFRRGPLDLGPCAGLELGSMQGEGHNLENTGEESVFWLAAVGRLDVTLIRFRPFLLHARGTMILPIRRFSFEYQRQDGSMANVHTPQSISGRIGVFVKIAF